MPLGCYSFVNYLLFTLLYAEFMYSSQHILKCTKVGSVMRQGRDRLVSMTTDIGGSVLTCHVSFTHLHPNYGLRIV